MDRTCLNCLHCKRRPGFPQLFCSEGMWPGPIDYEWLMRFRYLPVDPSAEEEKTPLAKSCPFFESAE